MKTEDATELGFGTLFAMSLAAILLVGIWFAATTPDLDALPEYDCRPGQVHTTKECR